MAVAMLTALLPLCRHQLSAAGFENELAQDSEPMTRSYNSRPEPSQNHRAGLSLSQDNRTAVNKRQQDSEPEVSRSLQDHGSELSLRRLDHSVSATPRLDHHGSELSQSLDHGSERSQTPDPRSCRLTSRRATDFSQVLDSFLRDISGIAYVV
jgi:hypothetical protein